MSHLVQVLLVGMLGIGLFDAVAALGARRLGFSVAWAAPVSYLIYAVIGFYATRGGADVPMAAFAAAYVALFDATVGMRIVRAIGPPGLPEEIARTPWVLACLLAILTAAAFGAIGALAA